MKFYRINDENTIHLSKQDCLISNYENSENTFISRVEASILSECDGCSGISDIANKICDFNNLEIESQNKVMDSIKGCLNKFKESITISDSPLLRENFITGDFNYCLPHTLSLEITNKCCLKCVHCYKNGSPENNTFIQTDSLIRFLEFATGKINSVQITGGEAMLHPDFERIITFCVKNFNEVILSTTGCFINEDNVGLLKNVKVNLSLYANDEIGNDIFTKTANTYTKVLKAVNILVENNVYVCINSIATDKNINSIENFIRFVQSLETNGVGIGMIFRCGRACNLSDEYSLSEKNGLYLETLCEEYNDKYKDNMFVNPFHYKAQGNEFNCGKYKWVINEYGDVLPCAFFPRQFALTNIYDDDFYEKIKFNNTEDLVDKLLIWDKELKLNNLGIELVCPKLAMLK